MWWIVDITINVLQTPFRALVADKATDAQQIPMQVVFVFMMAIGNFIAFSMMQIYADPTAHMFELMMMICAINVVCVAIQSLVARETPYVRPDDETAGNCCAPVASSFLSIDRSAMLSMVWHHGMECVRATMVHLRCVRGRSAGLHVGAGRCRGRALLVAIPHRYVYYI